MISLDVNVDVHPQLQLFSILDHDDLQGRLLMSDYLVGGGGRLVVVLWGAPTGVLGNKFRFCPISQSLYVVCVS